MIALKMWEVFFVTILSIIILAVGCLMLLAPVLLVVQFVMALIHDCRCRHHKTGDATD